MPRVETEFGDTFTFPSGTPHEEIDRYIRGFYDSKKVSPASRDPMKIAMMKVANAKRQTELLGEVPSALEYIRQAVGYGAGPTTQAGTQEERFAAHQKAIGKTSHRNAMYALERLPFSPIGYLRMRLLRKAKERYDAGKATDIDLAALAEAQAEQQSQSETGLLGGAVDIATAVPGMGVEFAATAGLGSAAAKRIGVALAGKSGGAVRAASVGAAKFGARAGVQAALMPHRSLQNAEARLIQNPDKGYSRSLFDGYVDTAIEVGTELVGAYLPRPKVLNRLSKFLQEKSGLSLEAFNKLRSRMGIQGVFSEYLEERIGESTKGLTIDRGKFDGPIGDLLQGNINDAIDKSLQEFIAFSIPGAAFKATQASVAGFKALKDLGERFDARTTAPPLAPTEKKVEQSAAELFFDDNPGKVDSVASLEDVPSRTAFSKATGLPRADVNSATRADFVKAARQLQKESPAEAPVEETPAEETPPAQLKGSHDILQRVSAILDSPPSLQERKVFQAPEANGAIREELQGMSAREIATEFGYKKGAYRKQWMIDQVIKRLDQQLQRPAPEKKPETPTSPAAPSTPGTATVGPDLPTTTETPVVEAPVVEQVKSEEGPQLSESEKRTNDSLPSDREGLVSLASTLGMKVPKAGTKAYQKLDPEALRVELAKLMPSQEAPAKKIGVKEAPVEEAPVEEAPVVEKKPKVGLKTEEEAPVVEEKPKVGLKAKSTKERLRITPETERDTSVRDTSDTSVAEGLARFKYLMGVEMRIAPAETDEERDAEEIVKRFGLRPVFITGNSALHGFSHKGVIYINKGSEKGVMSIVGHELAHGTEIDLLEDTFDSDFVAEYSDKYYKKAPKAYQKQLDKNPKLKYREGVAMIVEEFFSDPKFRSNVMNNHRLGWAWIVTKAWNAINGTSARSNAMQKVMSLLKHHLSMERYKRAEIERRAKEFARTFSVEAGLNLSESELRQMESDYVKLVDQFQTERVQVWRDIEDAKSKIKKNIGMDAGRLRKHVESGKDYSAQGLRLDEWAQSLARETHGLHGVFSGTGEQGPDYAAEIWPYLIENQDTSPPSILDDGLHRAVEEAVASGMGPEVSESTEYTGYTDARFDEDLKTANELSEDDAAILGEIAKELAKENEISGFGPTDLKSDEMKVEAFRHLRRLLETPPDSDMPFSVTKGKDDRSAEELKQIRERIARIPGTKTLAARLAKEGKLPSLEEVETLRAFGRSNVGTTQATRERIFAMDLAKGAPDYTSRAWLQKLADSEYKKDPEKVKKEFIARFRKNPEEMLSPKDTLLAQKIIDETALDVVMQGSPKALFDLGKIRLGYRLGRSQQSIALATRDPLINNKRILHQRAILDAFADLTEDEQTAFKLELKQNGIDLTKKETYEDSEKIIRALSLKRAGKWGSISDVAFEFFQNSILWGPQTHVRNIEGNLVMGALFNTFVRAAEIITSQTRAILKQSVGIKVNQNDVKDFNEMLYLFKALGPSLQIAARRMALAWKYEYSPLNLMLDQEGELKWAAKASNAIGSVTVGGKKIDVGKKIRIPFRLLKAADEFARTTAAHTAVALHAYRIAKQEGVADNFAVLERRMSELVADHSSLAWSRAIAEADYQTFQQKGGPMARGTKVAVQKLKDIPFAGWLIKYKIPFSNFLINVLGVISDFTPGAGVVIAHINNYYKNKNPKEYRDFEINWDRVYGNQMNGILLMGAIAYLMQPDEDDDLPRLTGTREVRVERAGSQYRTAPPKSVLLRGKYVSYDGVEPIDSLIAGCVDYFNGRLTAPQVSRLEQVLTSGIGQIDDKNYFQGAQDILDLFRTEEGRSFVDPVVDIGVGFVPNGWKQPHREYRNAIADTRIRYTDTWAQTAHKIAMKAEIPFIGYIYKYDPWGNKMHPSSPNTWLPLRLLGPNIKDTKDILPVDMVMFKWNTKHPDKAIHFGMTKYPKIPGPPLTPSEFESYAREVGQRALKYVNNTVDLKKEPTEETMTLIQSLRRKAQSDVREELVYKRYKRGITGQAEGVTR